jgi:hypothetical protein
MYVDRSTGRLGGLNNSESGGVVDAKNLRVKVNLWASDFRLVVVFIFSVCDLVGQS